MTSETLQLIKHSNPSWRHTSIFFCSAFVLLHLMFFFFKKQRLLAILHSPSKSPQGHRLKFCYFRKILVKPVCLTTQKQIPIVFSLKTIIYLWREKANIDLFPLPLFKKEKMSLRTNWIWCNKKCPFYVFFTLGYVFDKEGAMLISKHWKLRREDWRSWFH